MNKRRLVGAAAMAMAGLLTGTIQTAEAVTKTWNGSVSTNWANASNWTGGLPGAGDDVVVPSGTTYAPSMAVGTNPATGAYASFTINASATVTCLGDPTATNEASGGSNGAPHGIGVTILCTNATVNGTLTANAQGFPGAASGGDALHQGPGYDASGSSHGGKGGGTAATYGSLTQPTALGSGTFASATRCGGGAIRLMVTDTLSVNGLIDASAPSSGRSGSGGSIWLTASNFTGSGAIKADGGTSSSGFPGGGGRIAIYHTNSNFGGSVSIAGGLYGSAFYGQPGTLWEPGRWPAGSASVPAAVTITGGYQYYFPDATKTNFWNLTVSNAWFEPHQGALQISDLFLTNALFRFDKYVTGLPTIPDMNYLEITNGLRVTGASRLYLCPRAYAMAGNVYVGPDTNAIVYPLSDTNAINSSSGGTTGSRHGAGVTIRCASATIDGWVNADAPLGFPVTSGPGNYGGYGGQGGSGGAAYGALARPTAIGSGGSGGSGTTRFGSGAVRLVASGPLTVNGKISASATDDTGLTASGGSIWLVASTLAGNGAIIARAGNCASDFVSGGGGRIALFTTANTFTGTLSVAGGTVGGAKTQTPGKTGTLFRCTSPVADCGAVDSPGAQLNSDFAANSNGVYLTRQVGRWNRSFQWTDDSRDQASNGVNNVAQYALSGLPPYAIYNVYTNSALAALRTNSGILGTLNLSGAALRPSLSVFVEFIPPNGTVVTVR